MTSDCIYRDTLLKDIEENVVFSGQTPNAEIVGANKVISRIKAAPVADVAPVVHGEWLGRRGGFFDFAVCSNCKEDYPLGGATLDYCPHCGAKMDLAE